MRQTLVVATIAVPLYAAILHAWIYAQRRREVVHLWLALSALGVAGIALGVAGRGEATSPETVVHWQRLEMASGALLLIGFTRWCHAFLGLRRPGIERACVAFAVVVLLGVGTPFLYADEFVTRQSLAGYDVTEALLAPFGYALLAGFGLFAGYIGAQLGIAARSAPQARVPFASYCLFAVTLGNDVGVGLAVTDTPQVLPLGYLVMLVGLSGGLVRGFVRSLENAQQIADDLQSSVEARSAELARKERQLVHGERLAALGTLAAGVAHEINDPLAFVSSSLNRVEESWADPVERRDVPEILAECHEGIARMRGTVTELLRLARRRDAATLPVDLAEVVGSVLPLVRAEGRFRARWTELLTAVPPVRGDPGLIAQVALQLLLNALNSLPEGAPGEHRIHVATGRQGRRVCLRVRDSGPPIPADELPHLFDPFAAGGGTHDATTRLGLAVTHQIVASHGGEIEVESDERGTEVTVWFPVAGTTGALDAMRETS
jgi:signal transduction histidine kinase